MLQENYISLELRGNCESFLGNIVLSFEGLFPLAVQWSIKLRSLPYYTHPLTNFTSCKTITRTYDKKFQNKIHNRFWQCHIVNLITFNIDIVFGFSFCSRDRTHWSHRGRLDGDVWWPQYNRYVFAHLSRPWSIGWVALSFLFVCLFVRPSRYGDIRPNLTSSCPTPPNPYIFWKLMIIAIQKWIRNTNTKTKTNTKTMTKTKTPRE